MICDRNSEDIIKCHAYNNGECMNSVTCGGIMATSPIKTIHNRVFYSSIIDPTLYHCEHSTAKISKYPYCPFCGEKIDK